MVIGFIVILPVLWAIFKFGVQLMVGILAVIFSKRVRQEMKEELVTKTENEHDIPF